MLIKRWRAKIKLYILACFLAVFVSNAVAPNLLASEQASTQLIFPRLNFSVVAEVVNTEPQRAIGLMGRNFLLTNHGMFFIFELQAVQSVWMKNTLFPLDVIFISKQGFVVSYLKNLQPCKTLTCPIYDSVRQAKYMLEVNAGVIDREKILIGEKVLI